MYDASNKSRNLEEIVEKYADMVYRLALARTNSKQNAEDVFQEVFFRLVKKNPIFIDKEHEKAWLIRVTINCTKSLFNNGFIKNTIPLEQDIKFETEEKHDVYYAVAELPQKYRTIIYLFYYEKYKINEISKILNVKEATIKTRLSRARQKLGERLKGGFEDE